MVSAGVLGVGLAALVNLHGATANGLADHRHVAEARRIAQQRAEQLAVQRADALVLPSCPTTGPDVGCRANLLTFAPTKTCTSWVDGPTVPTPTGAPGATNAVPSGYRLDVVIGAHPDAINQANALLATISVCWEEDGRVEEIEISRLLVPGA